MIWQKDQYQAFIMWNETQLPLPGFLIHRKRQLAFSDSLVSDFIRRSLVLLSHEIRQRSEGIAHLLPLGQNLIHDLTVCL